MKDCKAVTPDPPGWGTTSPVLNGMEDGGGGMKPSKGEKGDLHPVHWSFSNQPKRRRYPGGMNS